MESYEEGVIEELRSWQKSMMRNPSIVNRATKKLQDKINDIIPEKIQLGITKAIKGMVRAVLFGAKFTTKRAVRNQSLEAREAVVQEKINFYKKTAAAEGGITGAGGFVGSLADFPILLSLKIKMLFEIAAQYGFSVKDYKERLYILHIFQLAFCSAKARKEVFMKMENWNKHSEELPDDIHLFDWKTFQREYRDYIDLAKMAQLVPIIGAPVGVYVNYRLIKKLGTTAMNAYRMRLANARAAAANAAAGAEQIGKVRVVAQRMAGGMSAADLRTLVGDIRGKLGSDPAVVALIAEGENDSVPFVVAVNPAAQDLGLRADELVKQLGAAVNGRGGGKADLAQGSGKGAAGIDAALAALRAEIGRS